jgi:hypothetical protein
MPDNQPQDDDEDVIAMCVDCGSVKDDNRAAKDPFLQEGLTGVCRFCGGPVIVTYRDQAENIMNQRRQGKMI